MGAASLHTGGGPLAGAVRCDVDPWADDVLADPFPTYRLLRDLGAVVWLDPYGLVALPRYEEVRTALTQWAAFSSAAGVGVDEGVNAAMAPSIIKSDPPAHEEFRRPLAAQMSTRSLAAVADRVAATAEALVADVVRAGTVDAVADIARPYSLDVVCDFVGIPVGDRAHLPELAEAAFNIFGPANARLALAPPALGGLEEHVARMAEPGRLCPGAIGEEIVAQGSPTQIMAYTWPGIDTTVNALGSAVYLFARHPHQWELVRRDPDLIPGAFAEVLRMHAPVHYFTRRTTDAVEVGGVRLPAGTRVLLMYGCANRDERHYPDADRFDVTRKAADQLAFGRGIHLCVGMNLAKLEAHSLFAALARRVERFEIVGEPEWLRNNTLHGLRRLPVRVVPGT